MKRYVSKIFVLFAIYMAAFCFAAQADNTGNAIKPEAETVLDQMESVGRKMNSLVANLSQQKINTQLGIKEPEEFGELHYIPGKGGALKLRLDITKPTVRTIVISGDTVKFYEKEVHQLLVTSLKNKPKTKSFNSLAITFGSVSAIRENYQVSYLKDEKIGNDNTAILHLVPKVPGAYKEIDIWISRSIGLPVQQKFVEKNGDVLIMKLSDLKLNERFNAKSLIDDFKPADAKVITN